MKRSVTLALLSVVGVVLLMACRSNLAGGAGAKIRKGKRGGPRTFVSFIIDEDGNCVVSEGVGTLGAVGKNKEKIKWTVSNSCDVPMFVAMTHYQPYSDPDDPNSKVGSADDSIVKDPVNKKHFDSNPIAKNTEEDIETSLEKNAGASHMAYKYTICVSDQKFKPYTSNTVPDSDGKKTCLDPDVDIWP